MSLASVQTTPRRLEGKVVIVTGGASGIGASVAALFWEHGASLAVADIRDDLGTALVRKLGERASYVHCDVPSGNEVARLVEATVAKHGRLDVMYSNAGVIDRPWGSIMESTEADMDPVVGVNLYGASFGAKHAARAMVPRRSGCILFTTSSCTAIAGFASHPYTASKCAIVGMAKSLAAELGRHGIRVNCISPHATAGTQIASGLEGSGSGTARVVSGSARGDGQPEGPGSRTRERRTGGSVPGERRCSLRERAQPPGGWRVQRGQPFHDDGSHGSPSFNTERLT